MGKPAGFRGIRSCPILPVSDVGFGQSLMSKYGVARPDARLNHVYLKGRAIVINRGVQQIVRNYYTTRVQPQLCLQVGLLFPMTVAGITTGSPPAVQGAVSLATTELRYNPAEPAQPAYMTDNSIMAGSAAADRAGPVRMGTASPLVVRGFRPVDTTGYGTSVQAAVPVRHREPAGDPDGVEAVPARLVISRGIGPGDINVSGWAGPGERIRQPRGLVMHSHRYTMTHMEDADLPNSGREEATLSRVEDSTAPLGRPAGKAPEETIALIYREQLPARTGGEERQDPPGSSRPLAESWQTVSQETVYQRQAGAASKASQQLTAADIRRLSDQVYTHLEQRLKMERHRKGW